MKKCINEDEKCTLHVEIFEFCWDFYRLIQEVQELGSRALRDKEINSDRIWHITQDYWDWTTNTLVGMIKCALK